MILTPTRELAAQMESLRELNNKLEERTGKILSVMQEGVIEQLHELADKSALIGILGLGYVMGLRSSMILCAGGFLSNFVLVPLLAYGITLIIPEMLGQQVHHLR